MNRNRLTCMLALMLFIALTVSVASAFSGVSFSQAKQDLINQYKSGGSSIYPIVTIKPTPVITPVPIKPTPVIPVTTHSITITQVANNYVSGNVNGVSPSSFEVAVYIYVPGYGWVNKPYWSMPRTPIKSDGTFRCLYVTGGHDWDATKFMAFLVPKGTSVPLLRGIPTIPSTLNQYPSAILQR